MDSSSIPAPYPTPDNTPTTQRFQDREEIAEFPIRAPALRQHFAAFSQKRHRKVLRDNLPAAFNKSTIRKLARRGGVKRIRKEIYPTVQQVMKDRLAEIIKLAIELVDHRHQKTMTALDVVYALKVLGNPIYGCGTIFRGDNVSSNAEYMRRRRAQYAQNVRDTQARLERERHNRLIDERVRRTGGSVNLRGR